MKNTKQVKYAGQTLADGIHDPSNSYLRTIKKEDGSCCNDDLKEACRDIISFPMASGNRLTGATFDGVQHSGVSFSNAQLSQIYNWLSEIIVQREIDAILTVDYADGRLVIEHTGTLGLTDVTIGASTLKSATRNCAYYDECTTTYSIVPNEDGVITVNKGDDNPVELTGDYTWGTDAENAASASDLRAELDALYTEATVTVELNNDCACFRTTIVADYSLGYFASNGDTPTCVGKFK